ncbi:lysylphosphatidylglycerol synthase transmembrane domain-containing protein [Rhizohabitans arisaemae]|uniref:lysylphosphatidylglycerol synthase transmembrane domain-containing protein n=1 Tax=Rhizohabitans arisaemae TaxID=2720610 RepID=UPI0024B228A9|nr:lysylphosphatidylglycerol synthase transmembrane domain-containing protein [Rhizohabitans arisaemae]
MARVKTERGDWGIVKNTWVRAGLSVISLALAAALIVFLPRLIGTEWTHVLTELGRLAPATIALLTALWLASLWAYTFVLTSALPGLTHLQALSLNAAGSAVSNLLPFGGAAGVALTFTMTRGWGHPNRPVVVMTVVTGVWNTLFRFLLPAVGIVALLIAGRSPSDSVTSAAVVGALMIATIVVTAGAALYWDAAAARLGRILDRLNGLLPPRLRGEPGRASTGLERLRGNITDVVHARWLGLTLGMAAFLGLQLALLFACLHATGAYPGAAETVAAFALNRVLTTAVVSPSGSGFTEIGTATALVAMGAPPSAATAAVLLFWFYTYVIEIPWGGLALGGWALLKRRNGSGDPTPESAGAGQR